MLEKLKVKPLEIALLALSAFVIVGVLTFAGPCMPHGDGSVPPCHATSHAIIAGAVASAIASAVALLARNARVAGAFDVIAAALGAFIAASPGTLLPLCMVATMRCHLVMQPFARVMGIIIAVVGVIAAIRAFRSAKAKG